MRLFLSQFLIVMTLVIQAVQAYSGDIKSIDVQNETLFNQLKEIHHLTEDQISKIRNVFARSGYIGQGNPSITTHPMSTEECEKKIDDESINYADPVFTNICGARYMAPLYNPATEEPEDAKACIDQFEFPDIPCTYPVVWVRASEAAQICRIMGKRLCDAHEWEGACAGALEEPDYRFDLAEGKTPEQAIRLMREVHNKRYGKNKIWSYGPEYREGVCAASSKKKSRLYWGELESMWFQYFSVRLFSGMQKFLNGL